MSITRFPLAGLCALLALLPIVAHAAPMSLDDRIACQTAIDGVRWSNMLWPEGNPTPKPPLSDVLPPDAVRAKVIDQLRMEAALDGLYEIRIDNLALQAELDRMARQTRAPKQLKELYAALGNDAARIADCLARPQLVRAQFQKKFSFDATLHAETRAKAHRYDPTEKALDTSATEREITYVLDDGFRALQSLTADDERLEIALSHEVWNARLDELRDAQAKASPANHFGLRETRLEFFSEELRHVATDQFTVKVRSWPKTEFGTWWKAEAINWEAEPRYSTGKALTLASIAAAGPVKNAAKSGPDDTWWTEEFVPSSRWGHVSVWTGSEMIVWGGTSAGQGAIASGGRYRPDTDSWQPMSTVGAAEFSGGGLKALWANEEMIVWRSSTATGARYRPETDTWTALPTAGAPTTNSAESVVWTGKFLVVWGGYASGSYVSSGARFDPALNSWSSTSPANAPSPRGQHVAVAAGSNMLVWGGEDANGPLNDGRIYNPNMNTWSSMSGTNAPSARFQATAVWTGTEMIVWGGRNDFLAFKAGGRFDPAVGDFGSWQALPMSGAPQERYSYSFVWAGDRAIVWGGNDLFDIPLSTGASFVPATNQWIDVADDGAPQARWRHTAVWDDEEMIVWGGNPCLGEDEACTQATSDGARYNPGQNGWTSMKGATYSPIERIEHASLWTGEQLQVWGGVRASNASTDGGIFTPATATWSNPDCEDVGSRRLHTAVWTGTQALIWGGRSTVSTVSMASGGARYSPLTGTCDFISNEGVTKRYSHTAVWLGEEMIVWGGRSTEGADYPPGGMRYRPAIDSWLLMSSVSGPSPRYGHVAIAAGNNEMLVWGGLNGATFLGDGYRYRLSTNSWVDELSGALVPEPRAFHSAIWADDKMIVWGGLMSGMVLADDGGAYSPSTKQWSYITNDSAPTPRFAHTAVWTGGDMLVWGGNDGLPTNSGGRFRVSDGIWLPMSTDGAPTARAGHTAVWTGEEMFVWGGWGLGGQHLAGLGSYFTDGLTTPAPLFSDGFE